MASRFSGTRPITEPPSARDLVDKYSGVGLQFKVKFVGIENVDRKRGDAEAAKYCIPTLKVASQQSRIHKPKAALGLSLKGVSLYDETTKSITRVPLEKVTYVSHDPVDVCYIGIIISDKESPTGFKLYCFKAERPVAIGIVNSSKELFQLMFKLRQARKKLKEEKQKTAQAEENTNPEESNLPAENAPPPSYVSVSDTPQASQQQNQQAKPGPPEKPPPPRPAQPPPLPPRQEDDDPFSFSLDPPPSNPATSTATTTTAPNEQSALFSGFEDLDLNEPMVSIAMQQPTVQQPNVQQSSANPFATPSAFMQPPPQQQQQPIMNQQQFGGFTEPSITMDLKDAIINPSAGTTSYNYGMGGAGMGMGGAGMGMGGAGMGMGGTAMGMGGVGMGGFGATGMGGGMGMMGGNQFGGGGFGQANNPQQDIFSMPADPLLNSGFSQPLLPTSNPSQQQQQNNTKPQQFDAFSGLADLVSQAKTKVKASPPPPRYSTLYTGPAEGTDSGSKPPTLQALSEAPQPAQNQSLGDFTFPPQTSPPNTTANTATTAPAGSGGGFDDSFWGNSFGSSENTTTTTTPSQPPASGNSWMTF